MKIQIDKGLLWYCAGQALVLLIFYIPWLTGSSSFFFRDLTHYIEPFARFSGESLRHLELPLWNPFCYCGMSQLAVTLQNLCYPPTWLFALLPFNAALALTMVVHQLILGAGGYLLARSYGMERLPSALSGITLSMSGYAFCFTSIFSLVESAAWCPLVLLAVKELGRTATDGTAENEDGKNKRKTMSAWTAACAFFLAMQILAGYPDLTACELVLVSTYICWSAYKSWKEQDCLWKKILFVRLRAVMLGFFLSMPLLLPAFEWFGLSRRSSGLDPAEALLLSANWYDILGLFLRQPLADLQLRFSEFRPLVMSGQMLPYMASAFVGAPVITMALWSLGDRDWKPRFWFLGLLLFLLVLALGINTPLVPMLLVFCKIPIRFPVKLMFFAVWCLAFMSARGLSSGMQKRPGICTYACWFWILAGLAGLLLCSGLHPFASFLPYESLAPARQALFAKAELAIGLSLFLTSLVGGLVNLCGYLYGKNKFPSAFAPIMLVLTSLCLIDYAVTYCHYQAPAQYFQTPSLAACEIEKLTAGHGVRRGARLVNLSLEHFTVPPEYLSPDNLTATINMYQYSRQVLRPNTNIDFAQSSSFGFEGSCTGDYFYYFHNCYGLSSQAYTDEPGPKSDQALFRFCQTTATDYVLTQVYRFGKTPATRVSVAPLDGRFFTPVYENRGMNIRICEVVGTLPRAYFAASCRIVDNHEQALGIILDPEKSGFDPDKATILEKTAWLKASDLPACTVLVPVKIDKDSANSVILRTDSAAAGFLVLADQYYPGWVAEIDGQKTEILRANGFLRSVYVPSGKHIVAFHYQPASFFAGLAICALAFIWLLLIRFAPEKS